MYKCECGREFEKSQSFNGHKSNCIIHLMAVGKIKNEQEWLLMKQQQNKLSVEKHKANAKLVTAEKLQQWISEKHKCESCGKIMTEKFGSGRFCSRSCANTFSSSKSPHISSEQSKIILSNINKKKSENNKLFYETHPKFCAICGKKLSYERRFRILCGQDTCQSAYMTEKLKKAYSEGRRTGWSYHNEISYPEKYFKAILDANNISYQMQVPMFNGHSTYHLDFVINDNIDLEIDGSQHYNDSYWIEHDKERDAFIKSKGFKIYRFKWIDPNKKDKMQEKIDEFLKWLAQP